MKLALHSVSYSGTWGDQTILTQSDFMNKASELGYTGVELAAKRPHASPLDMTADERKKLRDQASELGLTICALASYHDWAGGWEHGDMAYVEKELCYFTAVAELARDLGAPVVRTYTGYAHDGTAYRQQWDQVVKGLREAGDRAADCGITLGVQNHSCIAAHPSSLLDLLADIGRPGVGVVLDAPFIYALGEPLRETVLTYGDHIVHSHLTDFVRRVKYRYLSQTVSFEEDGEEMVGVPPGDGPTDFREFTSALKEIGYAGWLSYEMCSPLVGGGGEANLDRNAVKTREYMHGLFDDIGITR
jgi:sugar phosphate isomerase/epimerase